MRKNNNNEHQDAELLPPHHAYCDPGHVAWTACDLVVHTDHGPKKKKKKRTTITYFSNPQLAPFRFPLADYCPIPDLGLGFDCRQEELSYQPFYPGERVGPDSRCFNAMYSTTQITNESIRRPACLQVTCDPVRGVLVHTANDNDRGAMAVCQFSGQVIAFPDSNRANYNETTAENAVFVCPRLAVLCPELYTCPDACWGRGECMYFPEPTAATKIGVQRPYCRCFDAANRDPACAPSPSRSTPSSSTTSASLTRVSQSSGPWNGEYFGAWMAPMWFMLLLFVFGTVRQLRRRGMGRRCE